AMDRDSAMQSGKLDGAVSDVLAAAFARDGGFEAVIGSLTTGSYKLVVGRNEPAATVRELKNKEIALSKNTIIECLTDRMIMESGLRPGDVCKVVIPQIPARMEMLNNGKIAAAVLPDPLATVAVRSGARVLASSGQMDIGIGVVMFASRAAGKKAGEIRALYRAYDKAVDYIAAHPVEEYLDLLISKGGFPESVRGALVLPAYKRAAVPERKDVDDVVKWLYDNKLIKKRYGFEELVDGRYVRQ
ncbi:MAG TPA: ABC transporter substrate-binding protein, partial [Negativicutes bacterium]|nr:ABC transporter substrate-binding protein [Negativicutes bacterium]